MSVITIMEYWDHEFTRKDIWDSLEAKKRGGENYAIILSKNERSKFLQKYFTNSGTGEMAQWKKVLLYKQAIRPEFRSPEPTQKPGRCSGYKGDPLGKLGGYSRQNWRVPAPETPWLKKVEGSILFGSLQSRINKCMLTCLWAHTNTHLHTH